MEKTNEQIAQEYCVPIPKTCQKLDWKGETKLYWVKHTQKDNWEIHSFTDIMINPILVLFKAEYIFIPAPNANKLFEALPDDIEDCRGGIYNLTITKKAVGYFDIENDEYDTPVTIINNHLAEALAKLYILFRE